MDSITLGKSGLISSRLTYGCMRIAGDGSTQAMNTGKRAVLAAVDSGYTLFDHADIYGGGACERLFGEILRDSPALRGQILIMTKCGIRMSGEPHDDSPNRYDFSSQHLIESVEGSLRRLDVEQIDVMLLHRPDYLANFEEVAAVLDRLSSAGKVAHFGVSNFSTSQVSLLQSLTAHTLVTNQIEINIHNIAALTDGTLDQCQELGMTPQAWSPIAGVAYTAPANTFSPADEARLRLEIGRQAENYAVEGWQIVLAWLLKHPATISPIIGSTTPSRIADATSALGVGYTREDWYRLLEARNGEPVA